MRRERKEGRRRGGGDKGESRIKERIEWEQKKVAKKTTHIQKKGLFWCLLVQQQWECGKD